MEPDRRIARCLSVYRWLIRLYPSPFRERFGDEMAQLFRDRLRDRARDGRPVAPLAARMCAETAAELARQRAGRVLRRHGTVLRVAGATLLLLLVPAVAMLVTGAVDWTLFDFVFAGTAIFGTGLGYEIVARRGRGTLYRCALVLALGSGLLLVWINGAVGLVGSENDDFNSLYGGVLAIGLAGAALARLRPRGMARTMAAMAAAHALVGAAALWTGRHGGSVAEALEILGVTGLFLVPFLGAAWLFRQADRGRPASTA